MPIMAISAGVGAGSSILSGIFGGKAAKKAAQQLQQAGQTASNNMTTATNTAIGGVGTAVTGGQAGIGTGVSNANSTLQGIYNTLTPNLSPYLQAGQQGTSSLMAAIAPGGSLSQQFSFDPSQIYSDPSYKFNLQQGTQAIQRSAAAQGGALGAGTQKSLAQYASGLASNEYSNMYNRALTTFQTNRQNQMQNFSALLGAGQFGTQQANQLGTSFALPMSQNSMQGALASANLGMTGAQLSGQFGIQGTQDANQFMMQGAGAQAAGTVGAANAYSSILPGIANAGMGYGMYNMYQNGMNGGGGGGGGGSYNWAPGQTSYDTMSPATTWAPGYGPGNG